MKINITANDSRKRLDKFLVASGQFAELSRNQIQKLIEQKLIKVNGQEVAPHYNLKTNDLITISQVKNKAPSLNKQAENTLLNPVVVDETAEFLVINKPAGLAVHGTPNYTLADWLKAKYPKIKQVGDDSERPGIVHRLDKEVSGLMVIAKTQDSFDRLKAQFQNRSVDKQYIALVYGKITKDSDTVNFPVSRSRDGYKMAALPLTVKGELTKLGRQAETKFEVVKRFINYTLLKVKIITGRTHQIRVHLTAYGHPLVGDNLYATAKTRLGNKKLGLTRIFLIADLLAFTNLAGEKKIYKISLSQDLKNILKQIK